MRVERCRDRQSKGAERGGQRCVQCCRPGRAAEAQMFVCDLCGERGGTDYPRGQAPSDNHPMGRSVTGERAEADTGDEINGGHDEHDGEPIATSGISRVHKMSPSNHCSWALARQMFCSGCLITVADAANPKPEMFGSSTLARPAARRPRFLMMPWAGLDDGNMYEYYEDPE